MKKNTRYHILDTSLKVEEAISRLFKNILRINKPSTKTLDNKGSSLSFKSKVDLLYDLDDINKFEYGLFIKFSEIRNQFVHNHNVEEYINLPVELSNYMNKEFPCKTIQSENLRLACSYDNIQARVISRIEMLVEEYDYGKMNDYDRFIALKQKEMIDELLENTKQQFEYSKSVNDFGFIENTDEKTDVEIFIEMFKTTFYSEEVNIVFDIPNEELDKVVHSRKKKLFDSFQKINKK